MKKLLSYIISFSLLAIMAYGALYNNQGTVRAIVAIKWICFVLSLLTSVLIFIAISLEDSIKVFRDFLISITKKRSIASWVISWLDLIVMTSLLAYSGWMITAVACAVSTLVVWLLTSVGRAAVEGSEHE